MLIRAYGTPDVFEFGGIKTPTLHDDELLVRLKGSSANLVDCGLRGGLLTSFIRWTLPMVFGVDASGEGMQVDKRVTKCEPGEPCPTRQMASADKEE